VGSGKKQRRTVDGQSNGVCDNLSADEYPKLYKNQLFSSACSASSQRKQCEVTGFSLAIISLV
jgi:hypothetical protein